MSGLNKRKPNSQIGNVLEHKKIQAQIITDNFKVSFQYLDTSQKYGSSFHDWEKVGWLSKMLDTLQGYCHKPLFEQVDGKKFAIYGGFPSDDCTKFKCPLSIPEDANWARIHILNRAVIVGHIVSDTFYVVFLDKTHKFYLTKKDRNKK